MKFKLFTYELWWLNQIGLWSGESHNFIKWLRIFVVVFLQVLYFISGSTDLVQCNGTFDCSLENVTYTMVIVTGLYTYLTYLYNEKPFQEAVRILYELIEEFDTYEYSRIVERFVRRTSILFSIYYIVGLVQYFISPVLGYESCMSHNNKDSALICGLLTPGYFPFDVFTSPGYEIAFVFQCVSSVFVIKSIAHPLILCYNIICHIISQLRVVKMSLEKICDGKSEVRYSALKRCVKHHIAAISVYDAIAEAVNQLMLMYTLLLSIVFTVVGFQIIKMFIKTLDIWYLSRYLIIFGGFFLILTVLSAIGQKLIDESLEVAESAYSIPWYNESIAFQKTIQLIILRSNKALILRTASVGEISFPSFAKVMSSTYSYLAVLYKVLLSSEET